ncbi:hypothetical protein BRC97_09915 [Halobacteriales archaeon QS_6_71_20]|nr:MAG: hypothetical protein BRC97_09915 [Halobacteriales archaeon QS_6_71_20]
MSNRTGELTASFRKACEEAVEEADLVTRQEVKAAIETERRSVPRRYVDMAKKSNSMDELITKIEVSEEERQAADEERISDKLEEMGVPDDLIEAVEEHLDTGSVSKAPDVRDTDEYLARQLEKNAEVLAADRRIAERRQKAIAERVVDEANEPKVLDQTIYQGEEGA